MASNTRLYIHSKFSKLHHLLWLCPNWTPWWDIILFFTFVEIHTNNQDQARFPGTSTFVQDPKVDSCFLLLSYIITSASSFEPFVIREFASWKPSDTVSGWFILHHWIAISRMVGSTASIGLFVPICLHSILHRKLRYFFEISFIILTTFSFFLFLFWIDVPIGVPPIFCCWQSSVFYKIIMG